MTENNYNGVKQEVDAKTQEFCEIAFEEAQMMCATPEMVFVQASKFMGFAPGEIDTMLPLDETYASIIENGCGETIIDARRWILARAWDAHINDGMSIIEAFQVAWMEAIDELSG